MPNWCWNHLTVTGDEKELQEFVEKSTYAHKHGTQFSFEGTLPRGDRKDWYDWSIGNWGTKWDACYSHIENNDKETGCTIHFVTDELDAGPILIQKKCEVNPNDTVHSLKSKVQHLEGNAFLEAIEIFNSEKRD